MTSTHHTVPLIIRGQVIEADAQDFGSFSSPPASEHLNSLVLSDPAALRDVHDLRVSEIIDFLVELGAHLDVERNPYLQQAIAMTSEGGLYSAAMLTALYGRFPSMLRREVLEELVEQNLGSAYLDGWVETELLDRRMALRAFGARSVHVIAGNSPAIGLITVINNALSRGDAIIKVPSNEPYSAAAIAQTMIDMAPRHPLTRHVSVAYWRGGDDVVQRKLYDSRNIEKIIAWGGFDSMRSIRQYLSPGIDLVALDPKLSASIIGADAFSSGTSMHEAAARAGADIGNYNQAGCVSARVLYVETGTDAAGIARANEFGAQVFAAIQALPPDVSSPHPAFDPVLRSEIEGIRHTSAFRTIGGRSNEGAVIVSQQNEVVDFAEWLNCRVANVVPVDSVAEALGYLTIHTQTIGIYPDSLKAQVRDECAFRGGQRIVSLGHATSMGLTGPNDALQLLSRMVRWIRDDTLEQPAGFLHDRHMVPQVPEHLVPSR
jgi:hypothetical protein